MKSITDKRILLVRDSYLLNRVHCFQDILDIIPKSVLAQECKIPISRVNNPEILRLMDLRLLGSKLQTPVGFLFGIVINDLPLKIIRSSTITSKEKTKLTILQDSIRRGLIKTLGEIYDIIPRTTIAREIGTNNNTMVKFLNDPGTFDIRFFQRVAHVLHIDASILFNLVDKDNKKKILEQKVKNGL